MKINHIKIMGALACLAAAVSVRAQVLPADKSVQRVDLGFGVEQTEFLTTAAATTISGEELQQTSAVSLADALYGKLLGLNAFQSGGFVGDERKGASLSIRGNQTFSDKSILVLVDGYERPIDRLTVEEVESVTVLKDAAALAMLGHEAINGAILVKTKRGNEGKTRIKVGYGHKVTFDPEFAPMLDAHNYAQALNKALDNDGLTPRYTKQELDLFASGADPHFYPNVDWKSEALRNSGSEDRANLSVFGGNEKVRYYTMMDYTGVKGLLKNTRQANYDSQLKYSKANIRTNVDFSLSPSTKMSVNVLGVFIETNRPNDAGADDVAWNIFATPAGAFPFKTLDGTWGGNEAYTDRNVAAKIQESGYMKTHQRQLWADARLTQKLDFWVEGLSVSLAAGYDNASIMNENNSQGHQYGWDRYTGAIGDKNNVQTEVRGNKETETKFENKLASQWRVANTSVGAHWKTSLRADDNFAASLVYNAKAEIRDGRHSTFYRANWMGHFHYDLRGKYMADLSLAANGSNRNYPAKWGFSPVLSLGYIYADSPGALLTYGKLRASAGIQHTDYQPLPWGKIGDESVPSNLIWQEVWNAGNGDFVFGQGFGNTWGTFIASFPSSGYAQEKAAKFNLGTDLRLWNALDVTADAYWQRRSHIMVNANEMNSWVVGIQSAWSDVGKVDSYGVEFGAKFAKRIGRDLYLNAAGMVAWSGSKIAHTIENPAYPNMSVIGRRVDEAAGLQAIGFFKDQADIDSSPLQEFSQVRPGDIKYRDVNGDGVVNQNDVVGLGYSDGTPALNYAFSLGAEYKGIGFNAVLQGAGNYMKNLHSVSGVWNVLSNNQNLSVDYYNNSFDVAGDGALYPRLSSVSVPNNEQANSMWFKKVNFLKLRTCELYYKLPQRLVERVHLSGVKVFVQGQNLLSFDNVDAMDAEVLSSVTYPVLKSVNAGVSLTF